MTLGFQSGTGLAGSVFGPLENRPSREDSFEEPKAHPSDSRLSFETRFTRDLIVADVASLFVMSPVMPSFLITAERRLITEDCISISKPRRKRHEVAQQAIPRLSSSTRRTMS